MKFRRAGMLTKIVIVSLAAYATISLVTLKAKVNETQAEKAELLEQVSALTEENAGLQYEIEHSTDPEVIKDIARNKLGLVSPGEKLFYDVSN